MTTHDTHASVIIDGLKLTLLALYYTRGLMCAWNMLCQFAYGYDSLRVFFGRMVIQRAHHRWPRFGVSLGYW